MNHDSKYALLCLQQALLGEVSSNLRAVTLKVTDEVIHFDAYFDGQISKEDADSMSIVETELMALCTVETNISHDIIRLDASNLIPKNEIWVYHRKERVE